MDNDYDHHHDVKILDVDTTEEYVLNPDALPKELKGWRYYRLEYGGPNEACVWEGRIMLPPRADPQAIVQLIMGMQSYEGIWQVMEDETTKETNGQTEQPKCSPEPY